MHYISSSCWNLLPCILKTCSCTFFSSGRNLSPELPPSLSDTGFLLMYHDFPSAWRNGKFTNLKVIFTPQNPLTFCFRETDLVSFSSMARHCCLNRANNHVTSLIYIGPLLTLMLYCILIERISIRLSINAEKNPSVHNNYSFCCHSYVFLSSTVLHILPSVWIW